MSKKGFTLTEILVVLVIAGILLALILPNTLKAIQRAQVTQFRSDLNSIRVALKLCYTENRNWASCNTPALLTQPANPYLPSWPVNPFTPGVYTLGLDPNGTGAYLACSSGSANLPPDLTDGCIY